MTHGAMIPTFTFPVSTSVPCNNGNCYKEAYKTTNVGIGIVKNVTFREVKTTLEGKRTL